MDIKDELLVEASEKFYKLVTAQTASGQPGDYKKALAPVFGLAGDGAGNYSFDVNSKAADTIFGLMDKFSYKGKVEIYVKVSASKTCDVVVKSNNSKLSDAIKQAFAGATTAAIKAVPAPAGDLVLDSSGPIVMVQNVK